MLNSAWTAFSQPSCSWVWRAGLNSLAGAWGDSHYRVTPGHSYRAPYSPSGTDPLASFRESMKREGGKFPSPGPEEAGEGGQALTLRPSVRAGGGA